MKFEIGDYVVSTNQDFYGETWVVIGFSHNLLGETLVKVSRPDSKSFTVFYPHELVWEDEFG